MVGENEKEKNVKKEPFIEAVLSLRDIRERNEGVLMYVKELSEWLADFGWKRDTPVPEGTGETPSSYIDYIKKNIFQN